MKILFITSVYYPDILGGGEISTKLAAESLANHGIKVDVLCCGDGTKEIINGVNVRRELKSAYIIYLEIMGKSNKKVSFLNKLKYKFSDYFYDQKTYNWYKSFFCKGEYDLIQTNSPVANMGRFNIWKAAHDAGIPVSHVFRCPALVTNHGINLIDNVMRKRNSVALKYVDSFAAPSNYILKYNSVLDSRISKGTVIPNAVEHIKLMNLTKEKIVLYAGALNKDKGVLTLAKACTDLKNEVKVIFVGKGDLKDALKAKGYQVIDWVQKEMLYELMQKSWLVILPSEWPEAFGRVLIEAVYNGTIPLASRIAGIPEILNIYPDLMFESGNSQEINQKIKKYLAISDDEYNEIIKKLKKFFSLYSIDRYSENWVNYINKCLSI